MPRQFLPRLALCALIVAIGAGAFAAFAQDSGTSSYTVVRGDTLDGIAAQFDVQTSCLATANDLLKPGELEIGQSLVIDLSCPVYDGLDTVLNPRGSAGDAGQGGGTVSGQGGGVANDDDSGPQAGPNDDSYTVERGDTLDTIAQEFNISVVSLRLVNELDAGEAIMPGMSLIIPADAPAYGQFPALVNPNAPAASAELGQGGGGANAGPGDTVYVVQPRDMIDSIGAQYDKQVACIVEANALTEPHKIFPGQTIIVPASCPAYDGFDTVSGAADGAEDDGEAG